MSLVNELILYGSVISIVFFLKFVCLYRSSKIRKKDDKWSENNSPKLKNVASFEMLEITNENSGNHKLKENDVYCNNKCPHCGKFINLQSHAQRYFAFDCNICKICYESLIRSYKV